MFCGSRTGRDPASVDAARFVGRHLAERGVGLVYGGGSVGLMGAVADACLAHGGDVTGVIPRALFEAEQLHAGLTELVEVESMHARKMEMTRRSDAFLVLPGGYGTLDETFEAITWWMLGIHDKPLGILDVNGFWRPLVELIEHMHDEGFIGDGAPRPLVRSDPVALVRELLGEIRPRR